MKKIAIALLSACLVFALSACSSEEETAKSATQEKKEDATKKAELEKKAEQAKKEQDEKKKDKKSAEKEQAKENEIEYKESIERKLSQNEAMSTIVKNYSVEKLTSDTPVVKIFVDDAVKSQSDANKQIVIDEIGSMFLMTANASFNADQEHTPQVQLYYDNSDTPFAENRIIMDPKEFKLL